MPHFEHLTLMLFSSLAFAFSSLYSKYHLSVQMYFHAFTMLVYFTPLFCSIVADTLFGKFWCEFLSTPTPLNSARNFLQGLKSAKSKKYLLIVWWFWYYRNNSEGISPVGPVLDTDLMIHCCSRYSLSWSKSEWHWIELAIARSSTEWWLQMRLLTDTLSDHWSVWYDIWSMFKLLLYCSYLGGVPPTLQTWVQSSPIHFFTFG